MTSLTNRLPGGEKYKYNLKLVTTMVSLITEKARSLKAS